MESFWVHTDLREASRKGPSPPPAHAPRCPRHPDAKGPVALLGFGTRDRVVEDSRLDFRFFWAGEGVSTSLTWRGGVRRALKTAFSSFTLTPSSTARSQLVHPMLARSVSTSTGSLRVSRAREACPSWYLSRNCMVFR